MKVEKQEEPPCNRSIFNKIDKKHVINMKSQNVKAQNNFFKRSSNQKNGTKAPLINSAYAKAGNQNTFKGRSIANGRVEMTRTGLAQQQQQRKISQNKNEDPKIVGSGNKNIDYPERQRRFEDRGSKSSNDKMTWKAPAVVREYRGERTRRGYNRARANASNLCCAVGPIKCDCMTCGCKDLAKLAKREKVVNLSRRMQLPVRFEDRFRCRMSTASELECPCRSSDDERNLSRRKSSCGCSFSTKVSSTGTETSDSSYSDKTIDSNATTRTCSCDRNDSRDKSSPSSDERENNRNKAARDEKNEVSREGVDAYSFDATTIDIDTNQELSNGLPSLQSLIVDNSKVAKIEELYEALEFLKIRTRDLRNFLSNSQALENFSSQSHEETNSCAKVSSCNTMDLTKETLSGLMTLVRVLKDRCHGEDAIVLAHAEERNSDKKDNFENKKPHSEKIKTWKNLRFKHDTGTELTKKDSAIGLLIFLMILIPHVKRFETISYLSVVKKILKKFPLKTATFIDDLQYFLGNILPWLRKNVEKLHLCVIDGWKNFFFWCDQLLNFCWIGRIFDLLHSAITYRMIENFFTTLVIAFAITVFVIAKFRKTIKAVRREHLLDLVKFMRFEMTRERILASRLFWFILGFCSHVVWSFYENYRLESSKYLDTYYFDTIDQMHRVYLVEGEDGSSVVPNEFDCQPWYVAVLCVMVRSVKNCMRLFFGYVCNSS